MLPSVQTALFGDADALVHKIHKDFFLVCFGKDLVET